MMEVILIIVLAILIVLLVLEVRNYFFRKNQQPAVAASVLLEKITTICKLATVQGAFKEIVNYQDSKKVLKLFPTEKKAIILVDALAHVGFDLNKMKLKVEQEKKRITIEEFPDPEIISIDTNIQYYDVKETGLNKFSTQNYTELNQLARETITAKIAQSNLFSAAQQQVVEALDLVVYLAQSMGWHFQMNNLPMPEQQKKLDKKEEEK